MVKAKYSPETEITAFDLTMKISSWADVAPDGVTADVIVFRLYKGWTPEEAVSTERGKWRSAVVTETKEKKIEELKQPSAEEYEWVFKKFTSSAGMYVKQKVKRKEE